MKHLLAACSFVWLAACTSGGADTAQNTARALRNDSLLATTQRGNALAPIDRSPMDMAYFPIDYPVLKIAGQAAPMPLARLIYSRPHRQNRTVFGVLVPYGQPWRLGANEATELELFAPATIQDRPVSKGRYTLYCIPQPGQWTLVLNTSLYTWGLNPDSTKDAYRFAIPVQTTNRVIEDFTMVFVPAANGGAELVIAWEKAEARLPILFK